MYELVIVWSDGGRNVYEYDDWYAADHAAQGFRVAFGNQLSWVGVRRKV